MGAAQIRFIQASDLHLGGRAWPGCFRLSQEQEKQRAAELRASLGLLAKIAQEAEAEIVLLPGDIFDRESADNDLINHFAQVLEKLPPVFIAPGNHDYHSPGGAYSTRERKRRGLLDWPDNVVIFDREEFTTRYLPGRPGVAVTAQAFGSNTPVTERRLAARIPRDPAEISILLLHGSRTQFAFEEAQKLTLPFTAGELLAQGFSYTALGHYHNYSQITDSRGFVRAAYGGRPFGAEFNSGKPGVICGVITPEGAIETGRRSLDPRGLFDVPVFCNNVASPEEMQELARRAGEEAGVGGNDLVRYSFRGTYLPGTRLRDDLVPAEHFAVCCDLTGLRPGYDLEALLAAARSEAASAESLFAANLHERLTRCEDEAEREILQNALDYGMRALRGLPVEPRVNG